MSRACLGKLIVDMRKRGPKTVFAPEPRMVKKSKSFASAESNPHGTEIRPIIISDQEEENLGNKPVDMIVLDSKIR